MFDSLVKLIKFLKFSELKSFASSNLFGPSKVTYLHFSKAIYEMPSDSSQNEENDIYL